MLRIKLTKTGKKNRPTWRVIVVEKAKTGKGKVAEYIGNYNPHLRPKSFVINSERYDYWVGVGAQPTDAILRLKGKYIDKNKDYQETVKTKAYKKKVKKGDEVKGPTAPKPKEEEASVESAPAVENESVAEPVQLDESAGASEEKAEEPKNETPAEDNSSDEGANEEAKAEESTEEEGGDK